MTFVADARPERRTPRANLNQRKGTCVDLLDRLLGHDEWTTRQVLERAQEVDPSALHRTFDIGHGSFYETAVHMIANVRTWTDLMNDVATKANRPSWDGLSLEDLIARHDEAMRRFCRAGATYSRRRAARRPVDRYLRRSAQAEDVRRGNRPRPYPRHVPPGRVAAHPRPPGSLPTCSKGISSAGRRRPGTAVGREFCYGNARGRMFWFERKTLVGS